MVLGLPGHGAGRRTLPAFLAYLRCQARIRCLPFTEVTMQPLEHASNSELLAALGGYLAVRSLIGRVGIP